MSTAGQYEYRTFWQVCRWCRQYSPKDRWRGTCAYKHGEVVRGDSYYTDCPGYEGAREPWRKNKHSQA